MATTTAYSAKNASGTLNHQMISGLWEGDDAITIAPLADAGVIVVGADGSAIFSQSANEGATITIRLQHTSPTHRLLSQLYDRQSARGVRIVGFPFDIMDSDSQEGGTADRCFIQSIPTDTKGTAATSRDWVLVTGQWRRNIPRVQ